MKENVIREIKKLFPAWGVMFACSLVLGVCAAMMPDTPEE
jgi:hypothetical protein